MSPLEIAANVLAGASILLAGRNSVHTWWTGIVGCGLFAFVFLDSRLYADTVLQVFFVITSIVGWWQWLHGDHGEELPVTSFPTRKSSDGTYVRQSVARKNLPKWREAKAAGTLAPLVSDLDDGDDGEPPES